MGSRLSFITADAERLSSVVPKRSIDYVIDIEGFFYYPDKEAYLREVHSVLSDKGTLFLAFFSQRTKLDLIHGWIGKYFDIEKEEDLTDNAVRALQLDSSQVASFADKNFPIGVRSLVKQFWGTEGTLFYNLLMNKAFLYKTFVLKKRKAIA